MVEAYLNDPELQEWFKKVFTLELLPLDSVETQFEILLNKMINVLSLKRKIGNNGVKFAEYVLNTFFEGFFPQTLWNHYETLLRFDKTNNGNEGNNNKMKLNCGAANPSIEK